MISAEFEKLDRKTRGAYILEFRITVSLRLTVGRLGVIDLEPGWYYYVGSARGGLEARLKRHFSGTGKIHWHIDYLTREILPKRAFYVISNQSLEAELVETACKSCKPAVKGFGCSDTGAVSHLFYSSRKKNFTPELKQLGKSGHIKNPNVSSLKKNLNIW